MTFLIISASLNSESRSRVLARKAEQLLKESGSQTAFLDLQDYPLPLCDGEQAYNHPSLPALSEMIRSASVILIAVPIYNFGLNAAIKNLVELTGSAWKEKTLGFLCAAGGKASYMSAMGFANGMMLDFRCLIIPRFVYTVGSDFTETTPGVEEVTNPEILERIQLLIQQAQRLGQALA